MAELGLRGPQAQKGHGWKSKPGYRIVVAGAGAVCFDYPGDLFIRFEQRADEVASLYNQAKDEVGA